MIETGKVIFITSDVIDVKFTKDTLPKVGTLLTIKNIAYLTVELIVNETTVRAIIITSKNNVSIGMIVSHENAPIKVPVGPGIKGRILNIMGETEDGEIFKKHVDFVSVNSVKTNKNDFRKKGKFLETGIKVIDFFTPIFEGNKIGMFGGAGVGKTLIIKELVFNSNQLQNSHTIFVGVGERSREAEELVTELKQSDLLKNATLFFAQMNEASGARKKIIYSALTAAEYFIEVENRNILFFVDNIFRFLQAGTEISSTIGNMPSVAGYQPTLASEIAEVEERIKSSSSGSTTSFQTIFIPGDDLTDPAATAIFTHLDGAIILDRQKATEGLYPAVDILSSTSSNIRAKYIGENHVNAIIKCKKYIKKYEDLYDLISILGFNELSREDKIIVNRARSLINFFTQNFHTAESFTHKSGIRVSLHDTLLSVNQILNGKFDNNDPTDFLFIGSTKDTEITRELKKVDGISASLKNNSKKKKKK